MKVSDLKNIGIYHNFIDTLELKPITADFVYSSKTLNYTQLEILSDKLKLRSPTVAEAYRSACLSLLYKKMNNDIDIKMRDNILSDSVTSFVLADRFEGPKDDTRISASKSAWLALKYAQNVDLGSHMITRQGCYLDSSLIFDYSLSVDKAPSKQAREALILSKVRPSFYLEFLNYIEKVPRVELLEYTTICTDDEYTFLKAFF